MAEPRQELPAFFVGGGQSDGRDASPATIGGKAYHLLRLDRIGLPVPPAVVLGTSFCRDYYARGGKLGPDFDRGILAHLRRLENLSGRTFGSGRRPLLLSVRSGAATSMPGMLASVLNVGLTDRTVPGLIRMTGNPRLAWDCYRRLAQSFAESARGCPAEPFERELRDRLRGDGLDGVAELDSLQMRDLAHRYLELVRELSGRGLPQEPMEQLRESVVAVLGSWLSPRAVQYRRLWRLDDGAGTAVTLQTMVFGNAGGTSGAGVGFTRDPATGDDRPYLDFLLNAQGEDVVSGRHEANDGPRLGQLLPEVAADLERMRRVLEAEFRDMQDFEFTVEDGRLYLLQTRPGQRTPWAALHIAVDLVRAGLIEPDEALRRLREVDLDRLERVRLRPPADVPPLATATPAGIGVAVGAAVFEPARATEMAGDGQPVILVREELATEDIGAITAAEGILTSAGSRTSHAAVVARQLGKACLVGCRALRLDRDGRHGRIGEHPLAEGDWLSLDGDRGGVYAGRLAVDRERPEAALRAVAGWGVRPGAGRGNENGV
jgi:pyruvate,orthophosphate dikinase